MPAIKQNLDQSAGFDGAGSPIGGEFVNVNIEYNASSVDKTAFVATRQYIVKSITARPTVAGTDGGAVTAVIAKAASGTAITAGTALHSGTINLKGTANTVQALTVATADALIPAGTAIGIDFTGTLTSATGVVTVCLAVA
jgi:PBP1b-binding outer membrane lipoprotein LpoB